jgi:hypothetical protein
MTPEQQQIAIAEACGWTNIKQGIDRHPCMQQEIDYGPTGFRPDGQAECYLPDYLSDLNAMHKAEKVLKPEQYFTFQVELARAVDTITYPLNFAILHATATKRAQAFLKTLNLWK